MTNKTLIAALVALLVTSAGVFAQGPQLEIAKVVPSPPATDKNAYYTDNRPPLLPSPLIKLPPGSIRPQGWLRHQMELMAKGFTGRLTEISEFCKFEGNAWTNRHGAGKSGWEEVPYWLRGYIALGYALQDEHIIGEAKRWVDAVLASQWDNGYFGSPNNFESTRNGSKNGAGPDIWPNMLMLYPLRTLYEATGDRRVLSFMSKYFRWQTTIPLDQFLPGSWQKARGGDNLDSIHWLYNRTGERWLLDLARMNHERTSDWVGDIPNWHVVNLAQGFREPGQFYQQTRDARYLRASERDYETLYGAYGQVPGGMYGSDELSRPGFNGPRQASETCGMAEMMYSDELLVGITGNPAWADRAEEIAFNSLPASMTPDLKGLHYLTSPNQVQLDRVPKEPLIGDPGDRFSYNPYQYRFSYNPYQYRCCQHNVAFAWPYFSEHLWMATEGNGLAAVLYAASQVSAKAGDGTTVRIAEQTAYPFDDAITFAFSTPKSVAFPLTLRIPGWCSEPRLSLNGKPVSLPKPARGWAVIDRTWTNGDRLRLELPMKITTRVWTKNRGTLSVNRGPLTYSLNIGERWQRYGDSEQWPAYEVFATTPWNYGLLVDAARPAASIQVVKQRAPADQPFTPDHAPIVLSAKGRRIPQWKQESNGMIGEVQPGPVRSSEPVEEITLIPMGCARLRIAAFPQISDGPEARVWTDPPPIVLASNSSYREPPTLINDGLAPQSSADPNVPRFSWAGARGSVEWVEYRFSTRRRVGSSEVYWADDTVVAGACRLPASWSMQWWDGSGWQPVDATSGYATVKDQFSRVRFRPVTTIALRIRAELRDGASGGIYQWHVGE